MSQSEHFTYPENTPQGQFDRYFAGSWKRKWWRSLIGIAVDSPIKVVSYTTSEVTGELYEVIATTEGGDRVVFSVKGRRDILGWRKLCS